MSKYLDELLIGQYVIIRAYSAGVFAGTLKYKEGDSVELTNARRLWRWEGSASLSQMAQTGLTKPDKCQFPTPVDTIIINGVIEVIKVTDKGRELIENVPVWSV